MGKDHRTKAKQGTMAKRTQDGEMSLRESSCSPCRMTYKCGTCNYTSELYHEMCTNMQQANFEKDVPLSAEFAGYAG